MMRNNSLFLLLITVLSLCSCGAGDLILYWCGHPVKSFLPEHQQAKFYDGKQTGLGGKIHLDGYYYCKEHNLMHPPQTFVFYEDGTCGEIYGLCDSLKGKANVELSYSHEDKNAKFRLGSCYELCNDTIFVDYCYVTMGYWELCRYTFIIISEDSIEMIKRDYLSKWDDFKLSCPQSYRYVFVPAKNLPNPDDAYIKEQKWMWKDEKEWKAYKERRKNVK